jgi:hypothetical protein
VPLEFRAAGGRPPSHHEVLLVEPDGAAWYLTGLPWPAQPPFDEIGAYRAELGRDGAERLTAAAAAALGASGSPGPADAGLELIRLDGREAHWSPERRPAAAARFVEAARAAIAALRERPWSVVHGRLEDAGAAAHERGTRLDAGAAARVCLVNRGEQPLAVEGGELRAGWGWASRPPSPLRLAERPPVALPLPPTLEPGAAIAAELGSPGTPQDDEYDAVYALVHLRWRPPVARAGEWLDGWLVAGEAP